MPTNLNKNLSKFGFINSNNQRTFEMAQEDIKTEDGLKYSTKFTFIYSYFIMGVIAAVIVWDSLPADNVFLRIGLTIGAFIVPFAAFAIIGLSAFLKPFFNWCDKLCYLNLL